MRGDKSQTVRLLDVFVIGPFLLWTASARAMPTYFRVGLLIIGYATIVYNARNYATNDPSNKLVSVLGSFPLPDLL